VLPHRARQAVGERDEAAEYVEDGSDGRIGVSELDRAEDNQRRRARWEQMRRWVLAEAAR
jgi:hypothetical protein